MERFTIAYHTSVDKELFIDGPLPLEADYDDVYHLEVDIYAQVVVDILNANWNTPETKKIIKEKFTQAHSKQWNDDKSLQKEFKTVEEYLASCHI